MVGVTVILLNEKKQVVDDGASGDCAFVIAVLIKEAMQEDLLESFALEPLVAVHTHDLG
jgi:hypothetical protein